VVQSFVTRASLGPGAPPADRIRYAIVVTNPNESLMPRSQSGTDVLVNFFDGSTFTGSEHLSLPPSYLEPRESTLIYAQPRVGTASRMEVVTVASGWAEGAMTSQRFDAQNMEISEEPDGGYLLSGRINSHGYALGAPGIHVTAVYYNAADEIIGASDLALQNCGCGVTPFQLHSGQLRDFSYARFFWKGPGGGTMGNLVISSAGDPRKLSPRQPRHLDLQVRSGFWFEGGLFNYAFVVRNPNEAVRPSGDVAVFVKLFDDSGLIRVLRSRLSERTLWPGSSVARIGLPFESKRRPTGIEVVLDARWTASLTGKINLFRLENVKTTSLGGGRYETSGVLRSNNALGAPGVRVMALYFDSGGQIVAGQEVKVTHCGCGVTPVSITTSHPIPQLASVEMFWSFPPAGL